VAGGAGTPNRTVPPSCQRNEMGSGEEGEELPPLVQSASCRCSVMANAVSSSDEVTVRHGRKDVRADGGLDSGLGDGFSPTVTQATNK